ncbi:MAG: 2-phospho-L-lactate transferase, partial [Chloroflexota bacterium]
MRTVVLAGGSGGAKLAHGLQQALPAGELTVVVNTGDDTERHGLLVMPDHDAVLYMLSGRFDDERGWGMTGETWTVMDGLAEYGEEAWFRLGDRDFATHIARTARIREGRTLTEAVRSLQTALGVPTPILPMADAPVRTQVRVDEGWLDFQEYFVHRRQAPEVREVRFVGDATPTAEVMAAIEAAEVIVIGPSNPIVSIGPILAGPIGGLVAERARAGIPVVAVSPIVGGVALKGPAHRMLLSLGHESSPLGVARIYAGLATAFVLDTVDAALEPEIAALGYRTRVADTVMADHAGRARLAGEMVAFAVAPGTGGAARTGPASVALAPALPYPRVAAIIPVGTLEGAKTRLGGTLDAEERHDLVEDLLARTVLTALAVDGLDDVLVVSPDREVLARAAELGARTLRQRSRGLNKGLVQARADVVAGGADAILVLPIDLPFVTAEAVGQVLARLVAAAAEPATGTPARVVLVTDRHGTGTNALGLRPPGIIDFAFGPGSRRAHRAAAEVAGAEWIEVEGPLSVDLDTPDDLVFVESTEAER